MNKVLKNILLGCVLVILMTIAFQLNIFGLDSYQRSSFSEFQKDSENLVIGRMINDKYNISDSKFGLQYYANKEETLLAKYKEACNSLETGNNIELGEYQAQVGLQGFVFSFLYNKLHISLNILNWLCSLSLAIVLTTICFLLKDKNGKMFSWIFYLVFLLSPWVTNFARNLYWVEFTWFLPLLFVLLLEKTNNKKIFLPLIFLSVFFKSLCGYEYLSTILLFTISFLIVDWFLNKEKRKEIFIKIFIVGIICVLAFICAIIIHASMRGNGNIILGIKNIFKQDVLRRTIGNNADLFDDQSVKDSINASYIEVIIRYCLFYTDVLFGLNGRITFLFISVVAFLISFYKFAQNEKRNFIMYIVFLITTLSWFVLGKAHSYIHMHMNYVLWYFGYVQICFYIIISFVMKSLKKYQEIIKGKISMLKK